MKRTTAERYSSQTRQVLLSEFDRLRGQEGLPISRIAEELGVSRATLHRWQTEEASRATSARFPSVVSSIAEAVAVLGSEVSTEARRDAILRISVWMRWPSMSRSTFNLTLLAAHCSYLASRHGRYELSKLPHDELATLLKCVTVPDLALMISPEPTGPIYLDEFPIGGRTFTAHDVMAKVAEYFLSAPRAGHSPSIPKAYRALINGAFSYTWEIHPRTFRRLVMTHLSAMPFIWADQHSPQSWMLDPDDDDFVENLDELTAAEVPVIEFLRTAFWAQNRLKTSLSAVVPEHPFVEFPIGVIENDIELPPASQKLIDATRNDVITVRHVSKNHWKRT